MSADDRLVLTASTDKTVRLLDAANGKEIRRFKGHTSYVRHAAISRDGHLGLTSGDDKTARLWDLRSGKELHCFNDQSDRGAAVALIENGRYALTAGDGLRLWNTANGELIASYGVGPLLSVRPLPDSRLVLCGGRQSVRFWRLPLTKAGKVFAGMREPSVAAEVHAPPSPPPAIVQPANTAERRPASP